MIATDLSPLWNHLWQSTLCAAAVWLLTLTLRKNRAAVRYRLWFGASLKFLVPFSVLVSAASQLEWQTTSANAPPAIAFAVEQVSQPFALPVSTPAPAQSNPISAILLVLWLTGVGIGIGFWLRWWRYIETTRHAARPLSLNLPISVMSAPGRLEPGVFGILRPVLLLPDGIADRLTPEQLKAVIAHELCHIRRRDNFTAAIHMVVETVFWFHPLVWWIRTRLVEERERACDEDVLRQADPRVYAEGILNVCKFYLESPLVCLSGVTGANLKRRIETIMANRDAYGLNFGRKLLLALVGILAVAEPVVVGVLNTPTIRAQTAQAASDSALTFEAASVKALKSRDGAGHFTVEPNRLDIKNMSLAYLIQQAYDLRDDQISGPDWLSNHGYDIAATSGAPVSHATMRTMLQNLLVERFHLATHWETRVKAIYRMVAMPNGPKMKPAEQGHAVPNSPMLSGGSVQLSGPMSMRQLGERLTRFAGKPVVDATNLDGYFTVTLTFASDDYASSADSGPVPPLLTTAVQEQLGLKLVPESGPIKILVVDHAEPVPTAN